MKILEVRDGFVKIESEKKIEISSFLELKGLAKKYIAQVIRSKNNGTGYNIYAKLLFVYDGMLKKYDKTMPDNTAEISEFSYDLMNNSFNYSNPIIAGKFISKNENILLDSNTFNNSTLISVDNPEMNNILVQNFAKQFKQMGKTVIIDMLGVISGDKYVAGRDFRLPLNTESLKFIYEDCLNDATADSKNLIKDIFADLAEYSKTVSFLPFSALKTIVDDMVEKSHIFKLLVLKNKLAKFEEAGYFASNKADAENLTKLLNSDFTIIDLSKVDSLFQNRYLTLILSELEASKSTVFVEVSNAINKKNIKTLLYSENINSTFITHSKFKYLADIKPLFKNYIVESTYTNKDVFDLYSFFLESMNQNNYLIVGECTNFVPLISNLEKYEVTVQKLPQDSISKEVIVTKYDSQVTEETTENIQEAPINTVGEIVSDDSQLAENLEILTENPDVMEMTESPGVYEQAEEQLEDIDTEENEAMSSIFEEETEETVAISEEEELNINPSENEEQLVLSEEFENNETVEEITDENDTIEETSEDYEEIESTDSENIDEIQETSDISDINTEEELNSAQQETIDEEVEIPRDLSTDFEEIEQQEEPSDTELQETEEDNEMSYEPQILPLNNEENDIGEFEELNELDFSENNDDDILVDIDDNIQITDENISNYDESSDEEISLSAIDRDIVEDVDKVFTTMKDESISDSDLDLIDTLNDFDNNEQEPQIEDNEFFTQNDVETLNGFSSEEEDEEGFLEPLAEVSDAEENREPEREILETRESATPMVPIYDAEIPDEDKVISDEIEQGDTVVHAKYGSGVVEKMIKYGNKNLYSINFDNVGRRLLDPTLTEIKKA